MHDGDPLWGDVTDGWGCPVCESRFIGDHVEATERMFGLGGQFTLLGCADCGAMSLATIPDDLAPYYGDGYSGFADGSENGLVSRVMRARDRTTLGRLDPMGRIATWLLSPDPLREALTAVRRTRATPSTRILDVGCGSGLLLRRLAAIGYTDLTGVDPFAPDTGDHSGVRFIRGDMASVDGTWDLLIMNHSFEHVGDPVAALVQARRLLHPGGTAVLRVPVADSFAFSHYRDRWVQLDAPRHLVLHTRRSLAEAARRAGWRVCGIVSDSTDFQFWGSEQYMRDIPLMHPRSRLQTVEGSMFSAKAIARYRYWADWLNRRGEGDQVAAFLTPAA